MTKQISEIFQDIKNTQHALLSETLQARIDILRRYDSLPLRIVLSHAYDPRLRYALPEGAPPFKKHDVPPGYGDTTLHIEARKLALFLEPSCGGHPNLKPLKREQLFVQMLERLQEGDATVVLAVKEKDLSAWDVTESLVRAAFTDLLPPEGMFPPVASSHVANTTRPQPVVVADDDDLVKPVPMPTVYEPPKRGRGRPKGAKTDPKKLAVQRQKKKATKTTQIEPTQ